MSALAPMPQDNPQKLILIDGYGFVFRAYHAMARSNLKRADGTAVGAVYAFTNMLLKTINEHNTDYIAVVFDAGSKTFRNDIYEDYKSNRPPAPDDLIPQFPLVREAAEALNLAVIEKEGYEADDIIATYTKQAVESNHEVVIISSDKDLMQLIGQGVTMFDPLKSRVIGPEQVLEKFGVAPNKVLDVLSLMGDSSDNVPGVPGIGPKTAAELINQFGDLDQVLANTQQIKQNKRRQSLEENKEQALLSRTLITLHESVPLDTPIEDFAVKEIDNTQAATFLKAQGFKSLTAKFQQADTPINASNNNLSTSQQTLIETAESLQEWINKLSEIEAISLHLEHDNKSNNNIGIAISDGKKSCYIPLQANNTAIQTSLFADEDTQQPQFTLSNILNILQNILTDTSIIKISHNIKSLIKLALTENIIINPFDDIMVMSYSFQAGQHNHDLENIINIYLPTFSEEYQDSKTLATLEPKKAMPYICIKADAMLQIHKTLQQKLIANKATTLYQTIDKQLINVLSAMENTGIKLNSSKLLDLSNDFAQEINKYEQEIYKLAGEEFNIGSPKQLGEILFEKLGIKGGKKSKKTGAYSTDAKVLQALADEGNQLASTILEWRHLSKIKSTYTDALPKQIQPDGRVHTTYSLASTNTGRLSSHDPNLQNIPIRTASGNKIRSAFIAEPNNKLISADYSQIELRLLAHIADIDILKQAFKNNQDIHAATASQMFATDINEVTPELRRKAKMINFGIIYGISAFGLAYRLGITRTEAATYIEKYFQQYPGIQKYMDQTIAFAREHQYVETIYKRKCYINGINDRNGAIKQFSERAAINAPLQGSAADIIKIAMIKLHNEIHQKYPKANILLQVHDELIIEAPEEISQKVADLTKNIMQNVANLSIPMTVDIGIGDNWQEIH